MNKITKNLDELNSEYEKWILEQEIIANSELSGELLDTAKNHIESCFNCLARMKQGVQLLNNDKNVNRAFRLMNRSMLRSFSLICRTASKISFLPAPGA